MTQEERPAWKLDRNEQRMLVITFIGGLASIIVGACLIGGAIALARYEEHAPGFSILGLTLYSVTTVAAVATWAAYTRWGYAECRADL